MTQVAICSEKNSDKVVKYVDLDKFTAQFQTMLNNGDIYGCYLDENGNIVAQDVWDEIHENVLIS